MFDLYMAASREAVDPIALSIPHAVSISGIGRTRLYELIAAGDIDARKFGSKTLVVASSLAPT